MLPQLERYMLRADGLEAITLDEAGQIDLWDLNTGSLIRSIKRLGYVHEYWNLSPNERWLAVVVWKENNRSDTQVCMIDLERGDVAWSANTRGRWALTTAFTSDSSGILISLSENRIGVFDVLTGTERFALPDYDPSIVACGYFNNGAQYYLARRGGVIDIWNTTTHALEEKRQIENGTIKPLNALGAQTRFLYQVGDAIKEHNPETDTTLPVLDISSDIEVFIAYRPHEGRYMVLLMRAADQSGDPIVTLIDLDNDGTVIASAADSSNLCVSEKTNRAAFLADKDSPDSRRIEIWNLNTGELTQTIGWQNRDWPASIAFDSQGETLVIGDFRKSLFRYDIASGEQVAARRISTEGFDSIEIEADPIDMEIPVIPVYIGSSLMFVDEATLTPIGKLRTNDTIREHAGLFAAAPDGGHVLVASSLSGTLEEYAVVLGKKKSFQLRLADKETIELTFATRVGHRYEFLDSSNLKYWLRDRNEVTGNGNSLSVPFQWLNEEDVFDAILGRQAPLPGESTIFKKDEAEVRKSNGAFVLRRGRGEDPDPNRLFLKLFEFPPNPE